MSAALGPGTARPQLRAGANVAAEVQSPEEYFVLSRVDGNTSYDELCLISGLAADETLAMLRRFKQAGLIVEPGEAARAPERPQEIVRTPPGRLTPSTPRPAGPSSPSVLERLDDATAVDLAPFGAAPSLSDETKARVVRLHRRLKSLSPHELLGVTPGADPGAIKRAYFAASKELHPDRHFGRDIGAYRGLLSDIFAKLSGAFEQLSAESRKK